jgi:hypothetical protein
MQFGWYQYAPGERGQVQQVQQVQVVQHKKLLNITHHTEFLLYLCKCWQEKPDMKQ